MTRVSGFANTKQAHSPLTFTNLDHAPATVAYIVSADASWGVLFRETVALIHHMSVVCVLSVT